MYSHALTSNTIGNTVNSIGLSKPTKPKKVVKKSALSVQGTVITASSGQPSVGIKVPAPKRNNVGSVAGSVAQQHFQRVPYFSGVDEKTNDQGQKPQTRKNLLNAQRQNSQSNPLGVMSASWQNMVRKSVKQKINLSMVNNTIATQPSMKANPILSNKNSKQHLKQVRPASLLQAAQSKTA